MENNIQEEQTNIPDTLPTTVDQRKSQFGVLFLFLFILGTLFMAGTYFFVQSQKNISPLTASQIKNTTAETDKDLHTMESDVDKLETKDLNTDLTEVDQELKNL